MENEIRELAKGDKVIIKDYIDKELQFVPDEMKRKLKIYLPLFLKYFYGKKSVRKL